MMTEWYGNSDYKDEAKTANIFEAELRCEPDIVLKTFGCFTVGHDMIAELMNIQIDIHGHSLHIIACHGVAEIKNEAFRRERVSFYGRFIDYLDTVGIKVFTDFPDHVMEIHLLKELLLLIAV